MNLADELKSMDNNIKQRNEQLEKSLTDKKEFNSTDELELTLKKHHDILLAKQKRNVLKPFEITSIFKQHFYVVKLSHDSNTIPAVYDPIDGVYTQEVFRIYTFIKLIEPKADTKACKEVVFNLQTDINIKHQELTTNKNLIPVNNGVYDTEQDKLLPFNHQYIFTTKIATNYNEKANKSPNIDGWNVDSFIKQLANNDAETELLLWQIIACVINSNRINEQAFFLYSVKGSTGKGTFQNLLINLVGMQNTATLKLNQFNGAFSLAQLLGKKLVIGDDNKINAYIEDNSNFNSVITHDAVTINQKGQPEFMAIINATVVQSFNGLPKFNNETALRRIKLVMFNNHFTGKHKDPRIKNDYLKRRDVLEYVLYKASHLKFEELIEPASSAHAMSEYMKAANPLRDFKANFFDTVVNELNINKFPTGFLYGWFKRFCEYNNYSIYYSQTQFTQDFKELLGDNWQYKKVILNNDEAHNLNSINKQRLTDYSYSENPLTAKTYNAFKRI